MAEENFAQQETEVMPENSVPVEVQAPETEAVGTEIAGNEQGNSSVEVPPEKRWPGWPGDNVFRILVPVQKVGGIIGRKGEYIKKTCEDTKARIKILDGPSGIMERCVLISAKEEPDLAIPPAMDGLLKVHQRIIDADSNSTRAPLGGTMCTRLLLAATQAGNLIGKQGATVKTIEESSSCVIRVLREDNLPIFALPDDSIVEVQGEPSGVHKAVELIATHLRKFLVDHSVIAIFEKLMQVSNARPNQEMAAPQPWAPPPQNFGMNAAGYGHTQYMPPQHQFDSYYPPPTMDKQLHQPPPSFGGVGRTPPAGPPPTGAGQQQPSMVTKVSQNMQVPLAYADAVIGTSGTNISYIRRASGATIAIQESRGNPDEMTVEINGSASQVQTAQQLIQNFIADAATAAQNPTGAPPSNPYPGQGYPTQPAPPGHAPAAGDYGGTVYAGNYGY